MAQLGGLELQRRALLEVMSRARTEGVTAWVHGGTETDARAFVGSTAAAIDAGVTRVVCHRADRQRDFSAVQQLIRALRGHLNALPDDLAAPLDAVRLGRVEGVAHHVEYALLELLSLAAGERPLVVVLDDIEWIDAASGDALGFVARRLGADPLALIVTSQHGPNPPWNPDVVITLPPADDADMLPSLTRDVRGAFDGLSAETQLAAAVAAFAGNAAFGSGACTTAAALRAEHLRELIAAGLVGADGELAGPLVNTLLTTTGDLVRRAHDVLAEALAEMEPLQAFIHRAHGTAAIDATELDAAAERAHQAAAAGRISDAVNAFAAIAGRHRDPARVCESHRLAGLYEGTAMRYEAALPHLERAMLAAPTLEWKCIVQRTKSWVDMWTGSTAMVGANELARLLDLLSADEVSMPDEIARSWASLLALYGICDMYAAVAAARRAPQHPLTEDDRIVTALFSLDRSVTLAMPGAPNSLSEVLDVFAVPRGIRVEALLMHGEWAAARDDALEEVAQARRVGALVVLGPAVSRLVMATAFAGDPKAAYGDALATIDLAPTDGSLLAAAAFAGAVVGSARATEWAMRCLGIGRRHGITNFEIDAEHALGMVAMADDRLTDAWDHLDRCDRLMRDHGFLHPGFAYARGDIAEVAVRRGDTGHARRLIQELEVNDFSSRWTLGMAARIRGMLGEPDAFQRSLDLLDTSPWERARTHLSWARATTDSERSTHAAAAVALFTKMGALPWAELARGFTTDADEPTPLLADPLGALTDRERSVALAVAGGLSNKEAAKELFISTKTVEAHLQAVYRKLGVASRTQLVARCLT